MPVLYMNAEPKGLWAEWVEVLWVRDFQGLGCVCLGSEGVLRHRG